MLTLAASAEQHLAHPAADAVVRYAREWEARILPCDEWDYRVGLGVRARIGGETVLVGSDRLLLQERISLDPLDEPDRALPVKGQSVIYIARNGALQGTITYVDPLRPESAEVLGTLDACGAQLHLLTGDNNRAASRVARDLGIVAANTHAEVFPEQKAEVIRELRAGGRTVAFIGDGINDSPALAYADVSVSFGAGADVAREAADVVLMRNDLRGLLEAVAISQQAMWLIRQNIRIVAVPNLAALMVAATIGLGPVTATVINHGSMVVAGLNGLRPLIEEGESLAPVTMDNV